MSKVGIVAYIFAAIFVIFCFWFVGCSSESTSSGPQLCVQKEANQSVNGTVYTEQSPECEDQGEWF